MVYQQPFWFLSPSPVFSKPEWGSGDWPSTPQPGKPQWSVRLVLSKTPPPLHPILLTFSSVYDYGSFGFWGAELAGGRTIVAEGYSSKPHMILRVIQQQAPHDTQGESAPRLVSFHVWVLWHGWITEVQLDHYSNTVHMLNPWIVMKCSGFETSSSTKLDLGGRQEDCQ